MSRILLESICKRHSVNLPDELKNINVSDFGIEISLYDYQQEALKQILSCLHLFSQGKDAFFNEYIYSGYLTEDLKNNLNINYEDDNFDFLSDFYPVENNHIDFKEICNRASFWMATGSGKTLVMVKLIEVLFKLISLKIIERKDILILAPKNNIIEQIQEHINIFNKNGNLYIEYRDLREFEKVKYQNANLFEENRITIFYYRADNITDIDKTELIDYKTVLNDSNWYIILDEAHKGDSEFSKRQQYYTLLSKNGFLFNFSATFIDILDITTTVYNFNLKRFIEAGYGKLIKISNEEYKNFNSRRENDLTEEEKHKIVLKSLITYSAIKKHFEEIKSININLYHNPLLVTIANSVNTVDADLKIFFKELALIAQGERNIDEAKVELLSDFRSNKEYQFGLNEINITFIQTIENITYNDLLKYVFNSDSSGTIEVTRMFNNSRELVFKLTSSSKHFCLLVASEAVAWEGNILEKYQFVTNPITESFFKVINEPNSDINILLGSRIFSEGWDSNRPNIINFINIGVNEEAQKFVLQATGRGVRIEPIKYQRKRLNEIDDSYEVHRYLNSDQYSKILEHNQSIESLFIFATNKEVIQKIINNLNINKTEDDWQPVTGIIKNEINNELLIPKYKTEKKPIEYQYRLSINDYKGLKSYVESYSPKQLIIEKNIAVKTLKSINNNDCFDFNARDSGKTASDLLYILNNHFTTLDKSYSGLDVVTNEIKHYEHIQVKNIPVADLFMLEGKISNAINTYFNSQEELIEALRDNRISSDQFAIEFSNLSEPDFITTNHRLKINRKFLKEHYYKPILMAVENYEAYFKHIIKEPSELEFLEKLTNYYNLSDNNLKRYDWWYFSKLDENLDQIYIPYYNYEEQKFKEFYPDFIFWMKKDKEYFIKFIDPKGRKLGLPETRDKVIGFEKIFKEPSTEIKHNEENVNIDLILFNSSVLIQELSKYYRYNFDEIF